MLLDAIGSIDGWCPNSHTHQPHIQGPRPEPMVKPVSKGQDETTSFVLNAPASGDQLSCSQKLISLVKISSRPGPGPTSFCQALLLSTWNKQTYSSAVLSSGILLSQVRNKGQQKVRTTKDTLRLLFVHGWWKISNCLDLLRAGSHILCQKKSLAQSIKSSSS